MAKLDVVIPAGGCLPKHMSDVVGMNCKPLIPFEGMTIIYRTILALRESDRVNRIVLVGSDEVVASKWAKLADIVLPEKGSAPKNIVAGVSALEDTPDKPERILICTSDLCFLTPEGIQRFVDGCGEKDFYAPLIEKEDWDDAYPMSDSSWVSLTDGKWTLGGLFNVRVSALKKALTYVEGAFQNRKSKLGMAKLLGVKFVWNYLMKKLAVADVVRRAEEVLGASIVPLPKSPPELAFDIDALEDYYYALQNFGDCTKGKWSPPRPID